MKLAHHLSPTKIAKLGTKLCSELCPELCTNLGANGVLKVFPVMLAIMLIGMQPSFAQSPEESESTSNATPSNLAQTAGFEETKTQAYQYDTLNQDLSFPWGLVFLPDNTMLITERSGDLRHINSDGEEITKFSAPFEDIWIDGQAGLFDIALSPQFGMNNTVFLSYACGTAKANNTCLARAVWDGEALTGAEVIFRATPAKSGSAHYGGRIAFMPDSTLLLTLGDGFDYREDAQRVANHIGSVIRIAQDGSVPSDNPMLASSNAQPEIFSYGHRNAQGIAWHPEQQRMFISEHGPRGGDEINRLRSGANYGWPLITNGLDYTGALVSPYKRLPGLTSPEFTWTPSIAPAGLAVYYGDMFSEWNGDFLVPALAGRHLARLRFIDTEIKRTSSQSISLLRQEERLFADLQQRIRDVRVHPQTGALYLLIDGAEGSLIKVTRNDEGE